MSFAVEPCPRKENAHKPVHWIEIRLIGEDDSPVAGEPYRITLPNGEVVRGYLDEHGRAKVSGIESPGDCTITFPELDQNLWAPA